MEEFQKYFETRLEELLRNTEKQTAYFFRGFMSKQVEYIVHHEQSIFNQDELMENGALNLGYLEQSRKKLLKSLMLAEDTVIGFYEELIAISKSIDDIFEGDVVIVENTLFPQYVPTCLTAEYSKELYHYFQKERNPSNDMLEIAAKYYGDAISTKNDDILLAISNVHQDLKYRTIHFFPNDTEGVSLDADEEYESEVLIGSEEDTCFRLNIMRGQIQSSYLLADEKDCTHGVDELCSALKALEIPFKLRYQDTRVPDMEYDATQFEKYLRRYWGAGAAFRDLLFYKNPNLNKETSTISQGSLVGEIIDQCEAANYGDISYRDVFITAPTGAGKSLLFQLPALYLAERYKMVTLVITPLVALMHDQVLQLEKERHVNNVTFLNSKITFEERQKRIRQIKAEEKSIVYLAPELLLGAGLTPIIGERELGMVVIDEAHTVTSWGRDFRPDYWFLGDFLKKERNSGRMFPVLCLTATAVYSGQEDMVNDIIAELDLHRPILHLGNVKRENICFDIQNKCGDKLDKKVEVLKRDQIISRLSQYIGKHERTLVYCPFRSHVDEIYSSLPAILRNRIRRYHSDISDEERKMAERGYNSGEIMALICTKAFGMGVDVKDIKHVIHYAPSGGLSDYVQEVGRAARDKNITGYAHMDVYPGNMQYVKRLNGMSELKQFQLRAILKKLYDVYSVKKHRNLLVAPESFSHLFPEKDLESRAKTALLLLEKDLKNKCGGIPVIVVRPKTMLTENYVNVPEELQKEFESRFGRYAKIKGKVPDKVIFTGKNSRNSNTIVHNVGTIYSVKMGDLWENHFPEMTFVQFKYKFFQQGLMQGKSKQHLSPRVLVRIQYQSEFLSVEEELSNILDTIIDILDSVKYGDKKTFTAKELRKRLNSSVESMDFTESQITLLLDMMTLDVDKNAEYTATRNAVKILQRRKVKGGEENEYLISGHYSTMKDYLLRYLYQCKPMQGQIFESFVPLGQEKSIEILPLLKLLEILNFASYELRGGEKAEIFIRLNDPEKIHYLAEHQYHNSILSAIVKRHKRSRELLGAFFKTEMDNEARWDLIEDYFLGREDDVERTLGIEYSVTAPPICPPNAQSRCH